jgi:hypothetical protein
MTDHIVETSDGGFTLTGLSETSRNVFDVGGLLRATVTLGPDEFATLHDQPVQVIEPQGDGTLVWITFAFGVYHFGTAPYISVTNPLTFVNVEDYDTNPLGGQAAGLSLELTTLILSEEDWFEAAASTDPGGDGSLFDPPAGGFGAWAIAASNATDGDGTVDLHLYYVVIEF